MKPSQSAILFFLSAASSAGAMSVRDARESIEAWDVENHANGERRLNSASAMSMPDVAEELYFGGSYVGAQETDPKACPPTHAPTPMTPWATPWNGANWSGANWNGPPEWNGGASWNGAYWKPKSSKAHYNYGWHAGGNPKPDAPDPCKVPRGSTCNGFSYYMIKKVGEVDEATSGGSVPWMDALDDTPPGCALAPVTSAEEFDDLVEEARLLGSENVWLGVTKSALDVKNDNAGAGSRANWYNLDGTKAAVCNPAIWRTYGNDDPPAPDNSQGGEKFVALLFGNNNDFDGKLTDYKNLPSNVGNKFKVKHGLYKCCKDMVVFPSCDA